MKVLRIVGALILFAAPIFWVGYEIGFGRGYIEGHHENTRYYNGVETAHDIEQTLDMYHNAQNGGMTNVLRSCRLSLRKYVSRYQIILRGRDPGDYFRETFREACRIANEDSDK